MNSNVYPSPPPYFTLFTNEAKNDVHHPHHFVFTPPPPSSTFLPQLNAIAPDAPMYNIPSSIPDSYKVPSANPATSALLRFHPAVEYKRELRRLHKILAKQYVYMSQFLSSPNTSSDCSAFLTFLGRILFQIMHLLSLLREHQAKHQVLEHIKQQTLLNKQKAQELRKVTQHTQAMINSLAVVDTHSQSKTVTIESQHHDVVANTTTTPQPTEKTETQMNDDDDDEIEIEFE